MVAVSLKKDFFQAEDGIRDFCLSRGLGDVYKRQVHALSFPGWWYSTIKENLNRSIDLLTWKHRTTQWQLLLTPKGHKMLDDPELKVILVKDKGQYHR